MASTTAAPAAATASVSAPITAPITATITAATVVLAAAVGTAGRARRVVLSGIVVGRKILGSRSVRFGLALFGGVMNVVMAFVVNFGDMSVGDFAYCNGLFDDSGLGVVRKGIVFGRVVVRGIVPGFFNVGFVRVNILMPVGGGVSKCFAGKQFDNVGRRRRIRGGGGGSIGMGVPVIVVFEIFENIADVEERIAIKADVNESGLHAGEDAGDSAFVDATDEGELFFALDVNFD